VSELELELAAEAPPAPRRVKVRIAGGTWALPLEAVHEVVPVGAITPVPRARACVRGLTSVRGRIVPVIDPAIAMASSGEPSLLDGDARIVIVGVGERRIGVLVGRVDAVEPTAAPLLDVTTLVEAR
jgi:chemotaxis signal transduction protein